MKPEASTSRMSHHRWWLCFVVNAVVPASAYLLALLQLGADTTQTPLILMVLLIGIVLGWVLPADWSITPRQVAMAALAGASAGWLVAVVFTWGFALLGMWMLPAYALASYAGRRAGLRRAR